MTATSIVHIARTSLQAIGSNCGGVWVVRIQSAKTLGANKITEITVTFIVSHFDFKETDR